MSEAGLNVEIDSDGFRKTMKALDLFAPDLRKQLLTDIRDITRGIRSDAAARFPVRTGQGRAGFRQSVRVRGTDDIRGAIYNKTRQSQILEFAGSKSSGQTKQGQGLIRSLTAEYGEPGRFLWDEYDQRNVPQEINAAVARAEQALQERLGRADT